MATAQSVNESLASRGQRHTLWQHVVAMLGRLDASAEDAVLAENLVVGLFARGELATAADAEAALGAWQAARVLAGELAA